MPRVEDGATEAKRASIKRALEYMGLQGGEKIADIAIDRVFIGSCTNGRIEDLRAAAKIVEGRKVAERVNAMVVPGSGLVKAQAEAEGLDKIFTRRRLRMARAGLLDVPGDEPRQARAGRALRLDLEPQLRGPPGLQGPHPPRLAGDGGGGGDRGAVRRREGVAVERPMRIEQIRLKNFKTFQDVTVKDIQPFTVLVGANGSGKSTLFDVFGFLARLFEGQCALRIGESRRFSRSRDARSRSEKQLKSNSRLECRLRIAIRAAIGP